MPTPQSSKNQEVPLAKQYSKDWGDLPKPRACGRVKHDRWYVEHPCYVPMNLSTFGYGRSMGPKA